MKAQKYSKEGKLLSEVDLPAIFQTGVSLGAIYNAIKAENANYRTGNHATKTRTDVRGGGKKPWAQKGTGRARQGSIRAPQWRGGGTVHGPQKRDYSFSIPKKAKRKAVLSILNKKADELKVKIIEDLNPDTFSTKAMAAVLKNMESYNKGNVAFLSAGENKHLTKSLSNIPFVKHVNSKRINCRDIYYNQQLIISESALAEMVEHYAKESGK